MSLSAPGAARPGTDLRSGPAGTDPGVEGAASEVRRRAAAERAVELLGWEGELLPELAFPDDRVFPVVVWPAGRPAAHTRLPVLDRTVLSLWENWPAGTGSVPPPPPVRIVGFVAVGPQDRTFRAVSRLRGYGAGACVVDGPEPGRAALARARAVGAGVLHVGEGGVRLLVRGRPGPVGTARRTVAVRHREEVLLGWHLGQATPGSGGRRRDVDAVSAVSAPATPSP